MKNIINIIIINIYIMNYELSLYVYTQIKFR